MNVLESREIYILIAERAKVISKIYSNLRASNSSLTNSDKKNIKHHVDRLNELLDLTLR